MEQTTAGTSEVRLEGPNSELSGDIKLVFLEFSQLLAKEVSVLTNDSMLAT